MCNSKLFPRQAKENRQPSHRPSPFGGPSPRTRSNNPSPALETPDTGVIGRVSPGRMRESLTSGKPLYNNTFAQVLGSKITPPPPIFQVICIRKRNIAHVIIFCSPIHRTVLQINLVTSNRAKLYHVDILDF